MQVIQPTQIDALVKAQGAVAKLSLEQTLANMEHHDSELLALDEDEIGPDIDGNQAPVGLAAAEIAEPMVVARRSLGDALRVMNANDQGHTALSTAEMEELRAIVEAKVDGLAIYLAKLDSEADSFAPLIELLTIRSNGFVAKANRVRERLLTAMHMEKFETVPGKQFVASLNFGESVELNINDAPDDADAQIYPQYVRVKTKREWAKSEINRAIKAGLPAAAALGRIVRNPTSVKFDTLKVANSTKRKPRRVAP